MRWILNLVALFGLIMVIANVSFSHDLSPYDLWSHTNDTGWVLVEETIAHSECVEKMDALAGKDGVALFCLPIGLSYNIKEGQSQ